jgi:hypothetical protein
MKISPLAQGSGVPAQSTNPTSQTVSPDKIARAKAIAMGEEPQEQAQSSGDPQVDKINTRRIKMKTNTTTNREDLVLPEESGVEASSQVVDIPDTNEPAAVAEETKPLSPQFAALMKAKRALQVKERELATREEALKSSAPAGQEDIIAKLKANPLNVLLENGVTYDQLTADIIAQQNGATPEIQALKAEMKALKEELNGQFVSRDQLAEAQVLSDIKKEIVETVKSRPDEYEAIREAKAEDTVKDLIHRTWKKTGEILDTHEAIELVENQLIEEALPFAKLKKIQSRLTPQQEALVEAVAKSPQPKPNTKVMRTLTNRDSASPVMDRRARAIAAMKGTLIKG